MISLLVLPLLVGNADIGVRIGAAFPAGGLAAYHGSSALFGAGVGLSAGPSRFEFSYHYLGLPGKQGSPYHLDMHEASLAYGYSFLRASTWGLDATAGAGYCLARRASGRAAESGRLPSSHLGIGFYQQQGRSRLSFGIDNVLLHEANTAGSTSRLAVTYLVAIRAGVSYVL